MKWFISPISLMLLLAAILSFGSGNFFAGFGIFMAPVPAIWLLVVWVWSFFWMQVGEWTKQFGKEEQKYAIPTPLRAQNR